VQKKKPKKENTEMSIEVEKRELQRQIDALLAKPNLSASEQKQADLLMSKVANLRSHEERKARLAVAMADAGLPLNDEQRAEKFESAFNRYLRGGDAEEIRTYAPLSTAGVPIPQGFAAAYGEALKSSSGIREVANVITTTNGDPLKNPFTNDTNVGERLNENDPVSLANPTFSSKVFGAFRYSSKGLQYSKQLMEDAGIDLAAYLSRTLARRISLLTNSEFTNGAAGGPTGVIPSLTQIQTSAAPTAITVAEIVALQGGALDAGYLDGAQYMFSPGVERTLKSMVTAQGEPVFEEMRTGRTLCGFPYTLNVDLPSSLAANGKSIIFGNFKLGVAIREVVPSLLVSSQKYGEFRMMYAAMRHDQDCQVVDTNALNVLQQHS
jgi:HK97 family phage major capsid protein